MYENKKSQLFFQAKIVRRSAYTKADSIIEKSGVHESDSRRGAFSVTIVDRICKGEGTPASGRNTRQGCGDRKTGDTCNFYRARQPSRKPRGEINTSPPAVAERPRLHFRATPSVRRVLRPRFSLLCISTTAHSLADTGKHGTERRGVSGFKKEATE